MESRYIAYEDSDGKHTASVEEMYGEQAKNMSDEELAARFAMTEGGHNGEEVWNVRVLPRVRWVGIKRRRGKEYSHKNLKALYKQGILWGTFVNTHANWGIDVGYDSKDDVFYFTELK